MNISHRRKRVGVVKERNRLDQLAIKAECWQSKLEVLSRWSEKKYELKLKKYKHPYHTHTHTHPHTHTHTYIQTHTHTHTIHQGQMWWCGQRELRWILGEDRMWVGDEYWEQQWRKSCWTTPQRKSTQEVVLNNTTEEEHTDRVRARLWLIRNN